MTAADIVSAPAHPDALEFFGAKPSGDPRWWRMLCPACCKATVAIVRDGDDWRLAAENGCSRGCTPELVSWWHSWRLGQPPPRQEATEAQRRYARGAVRRALGDALAGKDVIARARDAGRFAEAARLPLEHLAEAFARAGKLPLHKVQAAMLAGAATPARLPHAP